jgi:hypothetical protein
LNPFDKLGLHPRSGVEVFLDGAVFGQENPFERLGRQSRSGAEAVFFFGGADLRPSVEAVGQEYPFERLGVHARSDFVVFCVDFVAGAEVSGQS